MVSGHVQMGLNKEMVDVQRGMEAINEFPQFRALPIVLSEADPEGCAACCRAHLSAEPRIATRPMYPSYTAAAMSNIKKLADRTSPTWPGCSRVGVRV